MTDIVERLRECSSDEAYLSREAADTITRLRAENELLLAAAKSYQSAISACLMEGAANPADEPGNWWQGMIAAQQKGASVLRQLRDRNSKDEAAKLPAGSDLFSRAQLEAAVAAEREACATAACNSEKTYGSSNGIDYLLAYLRGRQDAEADIRARNA